MTECPSLQPNRFYHIYNRGNNRENVFIEERNYAYFMRLYARHISPLADTYAYCLLRNHFHLLIRVRQPAEVEAPVRLEPTDGNDAPLNLSQAFQSFFAAYAMAINRAYGRTGKLFQEHFGRIEIPDRDYLARLIHYIHFNPQKHGLIADFRDWPWSSYHALVSTKPTTLARESVMDWYGGVAAFARNHRMPIDEASLSPLTPEDFD